MTTVILVIHLVLTVFLIAVILLQKSEGGALGIGGNSMGGLMNARGAGNLLTKTTSLLALGFMITSLSLALLYSANDGGSIADQIGAEAPAAQAAPAEAPSAPLPQ